MNSANTRMPLSLKKAFYGVTASNFAAAGFGFLTTVIPARLMDISSFGRLSFIFSLVAMLSCMADFGFSPTMVIYYNRYRAKHGMQALGKINRLFFRFLFVVTIVSLPFVAIIGQFYHLEAREIIVVVICFLLYTFIRYCASIHQATGDWSRYNVITIITSVMRFLIMAGCAGTAFLLTGYAGYGVLLTGFLIQSVINGVGTWALSRPIPFSAAVLLPEERREILQTILPLGLSAIVIVVCMRFDSLIIQKVLGEHELGIYSAANTLAFAFPILTGSLMNVLLRESAQLSDAFLPRLLAAQKRYLPLLLAAFAVALTCSAPLITQLFGNRYSEAIPIFRLLLIPYMGGIFFTPLESYFYAREPNTILWLKTGQMAIIVIGSLAMIDSFRLYGVAAAITLSRVLGWIFIYTKSSLVIASNRSEIV
jgi:O-antigen/teichoic acid export membrane protein